MFGAIFKDFKISKKVISIGLFFYQNTFICTSKQKGAEPLLSTQEKSTHKNLRKINDQKKFI